MTTPSYDDVRQQVERRYGRLTWFIFHVIMAVTTVAVIWAIDPTPQDGTPVIAVLWLGVLVFHALKAFVLDSARDRAIERAWQRYSGEAAAEGEKPKRFLRLADDANMEVVEDETVDEKSELRRRG